MFHRLLSDDSKQVIQTAERLSEFTLRSIREFQSDMNASHRRAILITYLSSRLLQLSYNGPDMTKEIWMEAERLIAAIADSIGDA